MKKEIEEFLREINDGKINKAQKKLANLLGLSESAISRWLSGKAKPTDDNIVKMAKFVKKDPKEIQKIFAVNSVIGDNNTIINKELELKDKEIDVLKKEIEVLKKEIEVWKLGYTLQERKKGGK